MDVVSQPTNQKPSSESELWLSHGRNERVDRLSSVDEWMDGVENKEKGKGKTRLVLEGTLALTVALRGTPTNGSRTLQEVLRHLDGPTWNEKSQQLSFVEFAARLQ